jgi:hypothetical protein
LHVSLISIPSTTGLGRTPEDLREQAVEPQVPPAAIQIRSGSETNYDLRCKPDKSHSQIAQRAAAELL